LSFSRFRDQFFRCPATSFRLDLRIGSIASAQTTQELRDRIIAKARKGESAKLRNRRGSRGSLPHAFTSPACLFRAFALSRFRDQFSDARRTSFRLDLRIGSIASAQTNQGLRHRIIAKARKGEIAKLRNRRGSRGSLPPNARCGYFAFSRSVLPMPGDEFST
jgi:ribosomal protein S30